MSTKECKTMENTKTEKANMWFSYCIGCCVGVIAAGMTQLTNPLAPSTLAVAGVVGVVVLFGGRRYV